MRDGASSEVTMLFTDIEGSTRLLNRLGPRYADVLADHRRILREAFGRWGGRELGTEGDSFFIVFDDPAGAVAAAAEGQLGLAGHPWPDDVRLRVRMGLHTGHPEVFEDNLTGFDVHLAARISATGHGGQVVLSAPTAGRVADRLPPGAGILALGVHRLKDIPEPQSLSQLIIPGLPSEFPPLRSLGGPGGLPTPPTPFVGRQADLDTVASMLRADGPRLVTLIGPGGIGKTRLSLAAAGQVPDAYPDGVYFVELATVTDAPVAWTTIAETVGRSGESMANLLTHLQSLKVLLVLDNLEQLAASAEDLVSRLVSGTTHVRVLATSRRPLHVSGEQVYPVPLLALPSVDAAQDLGSVESADAVRMFVQQAKLSDPSFVLTQDNVIDVVALCRRLDGLPLALELAAAQVRLLPPRSLLEHVDEALGLPLGGHPDRHRSLAATVTWSYGMVGEEEQRTFRALSAFGGSGATFDALAEVTGSASVLAPVAGLLDAALIRVDDDDAAPRVRALQTVRAVARRLLTDEGELDRVQERHALHYVAFAERIAPRVKGPDAVAARGLLEREMDNLRAALDWSLEGSAAPPRSPDPEGTRDGRAELGIRICSALGWYWYLTGYDQESRGWLERASQAASPGQGPQLARLLHSFGLLQLQHGDLHTARDVLAKSLALWRRAGDRTQESVALNSLGVTYRALGEIDRARSLLQQSVEVARSLDNLPREATALTNLGLLEIDSGSPEGAIPFLEEAERIDAQLEDAWGVAADRSNLTGALLAAGRPIEAIHLLLQLSPSVEEHGDPDLTLGVVELIAVAAALTGQHERAVTLAASAAEHRSVGGWPLANPDRDFLDRHLVGSRQFVGGELARLEGEGRGLDVSAALGQVTALVAT